jgi:hypothetical protein
MLRLPGSLSQRRIDAVLPTRPRLLEMLENVAIDAQRDELPGIRGRGGFRKRLRRLRRDRLESRFRRLSRVGWSSCHRATHITALHRNRHISVGMEERSLFHAPAGPPNGIPFAAAAVRTYTYQPVCEVRRVQFSDEYGWRVRDVRVCY